MAVRIYGVDSRTIRLINAIKEHKINEIESLITGEIDVSIVDKMGNNIFHILAINNTTKEIAEILIKHINIELLESKNDSGDTPLHNLIRYNNSFSRDIAEVYIKAKKSIIDITNKNGHTPLMLAIDFNSLEIAYLLIDNNADINKLLDIDIDNYYKRTSVLSIAIHHSMNDKHNKFVKFLIEKGVNLNIERVQFLGQDCGETMLHIAIKVGNNEIAKILINKEIDLYIIDLDERTVFDCAYDKNNETIVEMLLKKEFSKDDMYDNQISFIKHAETYPDKQWFLNLVRGNPEALSKLLSKFSNDERLKYTNHPWTTQLTYENFMDNLKKGWDEIKNDFQFLSPKLYEDTDRFLFSKDDNIGFSSSNICNKIKAGKKPNEIQTLDKAIDDFKQNIVIKDDDNQNLIDIFSRVLDKCNVNIDLEGIENFKTKLFTDVRKLEDTIYIILQDISSIQSNAEIKVTVANNPDNENLVDLKIIHRASKYESLSINLLNTIGKTGNFTSIYKILEPICYWAVEAECKDGKKRIEYLFPQKSNDKPHLISIPDEIEGFTHILRLYK